MEPRAQHYQFAHRALPSLALHQPRGFFELLRGDAQKALMRLWRGCGIETRSELPPDGLSATFSNLRGHDVALVAMPRALGESEAHYLAVVFFGGDLFQPQRARVFTLEASGTSATRPSTMIGEWDRQGHRCHGDGPQPDAGAFLRAVDELAFATAAMVKSA